MTPTWRPGRDRRAVRHPAGPGGLVAAEPAPAVLVVGGGIAGITAAVGLAERGVRVHLVERQPQLGGRVRSWPVQHGPDSVTMSRGFHAFFRQYYNLRALLRRVDPRLDGLVPIPDYPVHQADGSHDSFAGLPRTPPLNLLVYALRNPHFGVRGLRRADIREAMRMLDVDFPATYGEYDDLSAAALLDALDFPPAVRHLALEVFARSFFADPQDFSAGELLAMFHLYFVGSAEGLLFDVARDDFGTTFWSPIRRYLERMGVRVDTGTQVTTLQIPTSGPIRAELDTRPTTTVDAVVLAGDVRAMRALLDRSMNPLPVGPGPGHPYAETGNSPRFVVWRLWLDRPAHADRPAFLGTGGYRRLDNVSILDRFEAGARRWAAVRGGTVIELHAYALPDTLPGTDLRQQLRADLTSVYPETENAAVIGQEWVEADDCPSWAPGQWSTRPGVRTVDDRIVLAGDGIRCELPVALMERAATTGWQAANTLLGRWGLRGHDLWSVPPRSRVSGIGVLRRLLDQVAARSADPAGSVPGGGLTVRGSGGRPPARRPGTAHIDQVTGHGPPR